MPDAVIRVLTLRWHNPRITAAEDELERQQTLEMLTVRSTGVARNITTAE